MPLTLAASDRKLGFALAFGSLLCVGTYNALAKGLTPFLSPVSLLIVSEALTAVFIVLTFGCVPLWRELRRMDGKSIAIAAGIGILNSAIAPLLWFQGLSQTTALNASILAPADVLCILLVSHWLLKESPTRMQIVGGCTVFLGIVLLSVMTAGAGFSVHAGDFLILLATQLFGLGAVLFKKYLSHVMAELAVAIRNVTGVGAVILVSAIGGFSGGSFVHEIAAFPVEKVLLLLSFVFFSRYLNLTCFYEALDRLPATTLSLIEIAAPLSGMLFAVLILGENLGTPHILGGVVIGLGLVLEQFSQERAKDFLRRTVTVFVRPRELPEALLLKLSRQS